MNRTGINGVSRQKVLILTLHPQFPVALYRRAKQYKWWLMEEEPVWKILNSPDDLIVRVSEALPLLNDEREREIRIREKLKERACSGLTDTF